MRGAPPMWLEHFARGQWWSAWQSLDGNATSGPAAMATGDSVRVAARWPGGCLYLTRDGRRICPERLDASGPLIVVSGWLPLVATRRDGMAPSSVALCGEVRWVRCATATYGHQLEGRSSGTLIQENSAVPGARNLRSYALKGAKRVDGIAACPLQRADRNLIATELRETAGQRGLVGLGLHNTNRHTTINGPSITVPPLRAKLADARSSCRNAVLDAIGRLHHCPGATVFSRRDIVAEVQATGSDFQQQTIYRCLRRVAGEEPGSAHHDLEDLGNDQLRLRA